MISRFLSTINLSNGGIFGGNVAPKEKTPRSQHRNDGSRVNGEAIPVSLGVKPQIKSDVSMNCVFVQKISQWKIITEKLIWYIKGYNVFYLQL